MKIKSTFMQEVDLYEHESFRETINSEWVCYPKQLDDIRIQR